MVELLAAHTAMPVVEASEGLGVEADHVYVIPPGVHLSVAGDALHLSQPEGRYGARLPFDVLLRSLAEAYGDRAIGIVLSGSGADGALGARAVHEKGGIVLAQDPQDAGYDGMPRSAIATGAVDLVLPVVKMGETVAQLCRRPPAEPTAGPRTAPDDATRAAGLVAAIVDLLRRRTAHDFTLYKSGTVERRIERRMAINGLDPKDLGHYLDLLDADQGEVDLLAKDLLINVTRFFRDGEAFDRLAQTAIPEMLRSHPVEQGLRVWVVGCSTGEEAYSLAMVLREAIAAARTEIKLQIFASDVDPDAVAAAREGLYPHSITADISAQRLERFFSLEERGYRVSADLRSAVVFTVQDTCATRRSRAWT